MLLCIGVRRKHPITCRNRDLVWIAKATRNFITMSSLSIIHLCEICTFMHVHIRPTNEFIWFAFHVTESISRTKLAWRMWKWRSFIKMPTIPHAKSSVGRDQKYFRYTPNPDRDATCYHASEYQPRYTLSKEFNYPHYKTIFGVPLIFNGSFTPITINIIKWRYSKLFK